MNAVEVLQAMQQQLEKMQGEFQQQADNYSEGGDPLLAYGFRERAAAIDLALREVDAALYRASEVACSATVEPQAGPGA